MYSNELVAMIRFTDSETTFGGIDRTEFEHALEDAVTQYDPTYFDTDILDKSQWDEAEEGKSYDHIRLRRDGVDFTQQDEWDEYHDWLLEAAQLYEEALQKVLE